MSTTTDVIQKKLGYVEQNELNADMLDAITKKGADCKLDRVLREGANPNAIGVRWSGEKDFSKDPPLICALYSDNWYAVNELLKKNADPFVESHKGIPAIFIAIAKGNSKIVNTMLVKAPSLINVTYDGWTLLHLSIFFLTPHSVIYDGEFESEEIKSALFKNYDFDYYSPKLPINPVIKYKGLQKIISMLLSQSPSMINALGKNGVTPLDIIKNPTKFRTFIQMFNSIAPLDFVQNPEKFKILFQNIRESLGTDHEPTSKVALLTFEITLCNRYYTEPYTATIEYDFTELQLLFTKVEKTHASTHLGLGTQLSTMQGQMEHLQGKLTKVETETKFLMTPKTQRVEWNNWIALPGHENLAKFYHTIVTKFENTIMSFKSVDGGQITPKEGKVAAINSVIGAIGDVVSISPFVGAACEKFIKWGISKTLEKVDESRELNTANQVGKITWRDVEKDGPILARMLTVAFAQQLLKLPTPEEAEKKAKLNIVKNGISKLNALILKGQFISSAEIEAMVAMTWVVELLYDTPDIGKQVQEKGLANVFFAEIVGREPPGTLTKFWQSVTKTFGGITTKSGETWHPEDMYALTGMRTEDDCFYTLPKCKQEKYGWRLVTLQSISELKVTQTKTPTNLPPEYLLKLKIPQSLQLRTLPFNPSSEDNSLDLPMPTLPANGNSNGHANGNGNVTPLTFSGSRQPSPQIGKPLPPLPSLKSSNTLFGVTTQKN